MSHDKIMNCIEAFDTRIKKVEKLMTAVPELVRTVDAKLSASSNELGRTTDVVFRIAASIQR